MENFFLKQHMDGISFTHEPDVELKKRSFHASLQTILWMCLEVQKSTKIFQGNRPHQLLAVVLFEEFSIFYSVFFTEFSQKDTVLFGEKGLDDELERIPIHVFVLVFFLAFIEG